MVTTKCSYCGAVLEGAIRVALLNIYRAHLIHNHSLEEDVEGKLDALSDAIEKLLAE